MGEKYPNLLWLLQRPVPSRSINSRQSETEEAVSRNSEEELAHAIEVVNGLITRGHYYTIHGHHHPYGEQVVRKTRATLTSAAAQMSTWNMPERSIAILDIMGAYWLQVCQFEECAHKSVDGDSDIPNILYKYFPSNLIGKGVSETRYETQLLALNDDIECNVSTMKENKEENTLDFLRAAQSRVMEHLNIEVSWEELLGRILRYSDLRMSSFL